MSGQATGADRAAGVLPRRRAGGQVARGGAVAIHGDGSALGWSSRPRAAALGCPLRPCAAAPGCPLRPRAGSRVPAARHGRAVGRGVVPRAAAEGREGEIRALAATALPTRRVPSTRAASREGGGRTAGEGGATPAAAAGGSREGAARRGGSPAEGAGLGRRGGATRWRGRRREQEGWRVEKERG